jgi:CHAD domain-containing protein
MTEVPAPTLDQHIRSHTATLLRRMAFEVRQAALQTDPDAVHDLRVSIRRLRECLRTFADLYPAGARKKVRKQLRDLMKCAEQVRSADIALELLGKAGVPESDGLMAEIRQQRSSFRAQLQHELSAFAGRPYTRNWREALALKSV